VFDVGFSEMIVIAVVALIVLGPERLPKAARTAGQLIGRLQRYVAGVKADIERELQLEELKKLQAQIESQARELQETMRRQQEALQAPVRETIAEARAALSPTGSIAETSAVVTAPSAASDTPFPQTSAEPTVTHPQISPGDARAPTDVGSMPVRAEVKPEAAHLPPREGAQ